MPEHYPSFPHHTEIKEYLDAYAEAFGLLDDIEFGNGVVRAERTPAGGWEIEDQAGERRHFDLLVVANGHHWDPRWPDFPGDFAGESIHSHHYVDPHTRADLPIGPHPLCGNLFPEQFRTARGTVRAAGRRDGPRLRRHHGLGSATVRREIDAAIGMELVKVRTAAEAKRIRVPVLVQIADFDRFVPAESVVRTATAARARVHHYPCDHFDVWPGHEWHDKAAADQAAFLDRVFAQRSVRTG